MDELVQDIIYEISSEENINLEKVINKYCKELKKCFKEYYNTYGLEDYKMNNIDYMILYNIWKTLKLKGRIESYLIIMYSYYKLEDFHFPINKFKSGLNCIPLIQNTDVISIINTMIKF
tara:strand:- start:12649 stop:13005 length:357 start_codon:yes stop_codon:yes gene_type:complete